MEFTFGVVSYNSEEFIIETLESIKYQVLQYGGEVSTDLVIADDASSDKTIELIYCWIEYNKKLFRNTLILENDENKGTTFNYCRLIENVHTEYFVKIDGDDLFSSDNIYKKCFKGTKNECRIFYPIKFHTSSYYDEEDFANIFYYSKEKHSHRKSLTLMKTIKPFMTPQVSITRSNFIEECISFIKNFSIFEDDTAIYSVLKNNPSMVFDFSLEPFVLYRVHNKSVSNGTEISPYQIKFLDDLHRFRKYLLKHESNIFVIIYLLTACWESFLMKHRFSAKNCLFRKMFTYIRKYIVNKVKGNSEYLKEKKKMELIVKNENHHIELMRARANEFINKM